MRSDANHNPVLPSSLHLCVKGLCFSALQVYLYSFDVFREAGIPTHQLRQVALGTGLCEISTSVACVSPPVFHHSSLYNPLYWRSYVPVQQGGIMNNFSV